MRISAEALERTLKTQLFTAEHGRYFLRGDAASHCYTYADSPHVAFSADRIVVSMHIRAKLGPHIAGKCIGFGLSTNAAVSLIPTSDGETIGFRDARIDHISESHELNFVLMPFLSSTVPDRMTVNAADILRQILSRSKDISGYLLTLDRLKVHSMQVTPDALAVDLDADVTVK